MKESWYLSALSVHVVSELMRGKIYMQVHEKIDKKYKNGRKKKLKINCLKNK